MTLRRDNFVVSAKGWGRFQNLRFPVALGRNRFVHDKKEGDGAAPLGEFRLEAVYFRPDRIVKPRATLPTIPIRPWDGWCDDPADPAYNKQVRCPYPASVEKIFRSDNLYTICVVFSANRNPVLPGKGSALFVHIWRAPRFPTAGCIALSLGHLSFILRRWTRNARLILC